MTPEEIQAIRERAEKATEGPWEDRTDDLTDEVYVVHDREQVLFVASCGGKEDPRASADAVFISTARTNVPRLLAEVERLTEERDELQKVATERLKTAMRRAARLDKVRALHKPVPIYTTEAGDCEHGGDCRAVELEDGSYCPVHTDGLTCNECAELAKWADDLPAYPCPTIQAIDGSDQ